MLDRFVIFTKAGVVLWDRQDPSFVGDPSAALSHLIHEVLLHVRDSGSSSSSASASSATTAATSASVPVSAAIICNNKGSTTQQQQRLKYVSSPDRGLLYVAIYGGELVSQVAYIEYLLPAVERSFVHKFGASMESKGKEMTQVAWGLSKEAVNMAGASALAVQKGNGNTTTTNNNNNADGGKGTVFSTFDSLYDQLLTAAERKAEGSGGGGGGDSNQALSSRGGANMTSTTSNNNNILANSNEKNPAIISKETTHTINSSKHSNSNVNTDAGNGVDDDSNGNDNDASSSKHNITDGEEENIEEEDGGDGGPLTPSRVASSGGRGGGVVGSARTATGGSGAKPSRFAKKEATPSSATKGKNGKEKRDWGGTFSNTVADSLDRSKDKSTTPGGGGGGGGVQQEKVVFTGDGSGGSGTDLVMSSSSSSSSFLSREDELAAAEAILLGAGGSSSSSSNNASSSITTGAGTATGSGGGIGAWMSRSSVGSWLNSATGNKILERSDLEPVAENLRSHLQSKNVAKEVADELCAALVQQLEGSTLDAGATLSVTSKIAQAAERALHEAIERILTPRRPIDVLRDVKAKTAREAALHPVGARDPYVIVFCGVNGVGKSTTLAKVTYHLKDNGHTVLVAACDSFRSGAVEQLGKHCASLDVPLFERGYQKNPSEVASAAIKQAKKDGIECVLVDTAGRMQNKHSLMAELAQLVAVTKPDLVLFVGEALVGNDGVDQLREFARALVDQAVDAQHPRTIDGIVLTKFDTVDDKVGAALSMVHKTGIPVVFLGVGQQYSHLRKLNVAAVVKTLLS